MTTLILVFSPHEAVVMTGRSTSFLYYMKYTVQFIVNQVRQAL